MPPSRPWPPAISTPTLIDLNYSRDTTSGEEGLELLEKLQGLDSTLPVVVMTAWGSVEDRGTGHPARGTGFCRETLGQRSPVVDPPQPGRSRPGSQTGPPPGGRKHIPSHPRGARPHRNGPGNGACPRVDQPGRPVGCQRPDHRRAWQRQRGCRPSIARRLEPARTPPDHCQRRRPAGRGLCQRAFRTRQGRLYRRQGRPGRPLRNGRWRHPLPRRNRKRAFRPAGQAAPHSRDR